MSKRKAEKDLHTIPSKKPKQSEFKSENTPQQIDSAKQLKQLLDFHQDKIQELKTGLQSFKAFLESIHYATDRSSTSRQQNILHEYLQSNIPNDSTSISTALPNLMQAWSFAAQSDNDSIISAIPSVLALLLRTISTFFDFRDYGLQIGRTLLQQSQLKLIARSLSSPKHREHVISPCLRLVTEVVSFDGGTLANTVLAAETFTLDSKSTVKNLQAWKEEPEDPQEAKLRPSVRTNAVRYLLACLKYVRGQDKLKPLTDRSVAKAIFGHFKHDPVDLVKDVFETIQTHVISDKKLPRIGKGSIFNEGCLVTIASALKDSRSEGISPEKVSQKQEMVYDFLKFVCTSPEAGVTRPYTGWYPSNNKPDSVAIEVDADSAEIDVGLDSIKRYDTFKNPIPVRNITLSRFAQTLRPYANVLESDLLIQIFKSAPELVADFFFQKSNFAFDPKLTTTWIAYSSFLFSTMALPVPQYFGRKNDYDSIPPPALIVIENILPQPLTQKCLTRCLTQSVELIRILAIHILCVALRKLQDVFACFEEASISQGPLWVETADRVRHEFVTRCPKFKDITDVYRKIASENEIQKEAILRLIALYYEVLPQATLKEKFDVGFALPEALTVYETPNPEQSDHNGRHGLKLLQLGHLLRISAQNSEMRWWQRPSSTKLSPFTALLKITTTVSCERVPKDIYTLIYSIVRESGALQLETEISAVNALLASLHLAESNANLQGLYEFVDDIFSRIVRKPVKYEDDFDALVADLDAIDPVSLIVVTALEQWPFAADRADSADITALWVKRYLTAAEAIGEDSTVLQRIRAKFIEFAKTDNQRKLLKSNDIEGMGAEIVNLTRAVEANESYSEETPKAEDNAQDEPSIDFSTLAPPVEDPGHRGLHRWSTKDAVSAIRDGDLASLILCLSSGHPEVQTLALGNICQFATSLSTESVKSSYPEASQVALLLGLLVNTVTPLLSHHSTNGTPNGTKASSFEANADADQAETRSPTVPYFCTVYAIMALQVLQDPLHPLYQKINNFHTQSPKWDISKLPSYWTHKILFEPPTPSYSTTRISQKGYRDESNYDVIQDIHEFSLPSSVPRNLHAFLFSYIHASLRDPHSPDMIEMQEDSSSSADLHIIQRTGTLEPLIAQANNPFQPLSHFVLLIRILWRITYLPGGSTMLITRKGIMGVLSAWIAKRKSFPSTTITASGTKSTKQLSFDGDLGNARGERPDLKQDKILASVWGLRKLVQRIWDSCDQNYVDKWSQGMMDSMVLHLTQDQL